MENVEWDDSLLMEMSYTQGRSIRGAGRIVWSAVDSSNTDSDNIDIMVMIIIIQLDMDNTFDECMK